MASTLLSTRYRQAAVKRAERQSQAEQYRGGFGKFPGTGTQQFRNTAQSVISHTPGGIQKAAEQRFAQQQQELLKEQELQRAQLQRGFQQSSEFAAARQLGQLEAGVGTFSQRSGIGGSELAASLAARERGQLASQTLGAQQDFAVKLSLAQADMRNQFFNKKLDFFNSLAQADFQRAMESQLLEFKARLQSDLNAKSAFLGLGQSIGNFIGGLF